MLIPSFINRANRGKRTCPTLSKNMLTRGALSLINDWINTIYWSCTKTNRLLSISRVRLRNEIVQGVTGQLRRPNIPQDSSWISRQQYLQASRSHSCQTMFKAMLRHSWRALIHNLNNAEMYIIHIYVYYLVFKCATMGQIKETR